MAGFSATTCLVLAILLLGFTAADGLAGDGCIGKGAGRNYDQSFSAFPVGTRCEYFQPYTGKTSSGVVVPWGPISWLVPALLFGAFAFAFLGVLGRLLHRPSGVGSYG
ncbi:MAG: hypothetical protein U0R52_01260 [Solirubrobacterales bacterium]